MATKWNFLANSLKIFSSETASRILKLFHRDVPWVTLFKKCSWNFDPSKIVALVNGGFLHYTEMKAFFKNLLLWNRWSDCEIISQICSLGDPFQKLFVKFWSVKKCGSGEWGLLALYRNEGILKKSSSLKPMVRFWNDFTELTLFKNCSRNFDWWRNMALVNEGYLHYREMKKFLKILLLRHVWSDFEMISQKGSMDDPFQKLLAKFLSFKNMALVNGGYLQYGHEEIL